MEQPDATNSNPTKRTLTPTAEMTWFLCCRRCCIGSGTNWQRARAAEIKAVRKEAAGNCRKLWNEMKLEDGSYYTATFACFLACFSDGVLAVQFRVELKNALHLLAKQTDHVTLNVKISGRIERSCSTQVTGRALKMKITSVSTATFGIKGCNIKVKDINCEGRGR
jgi:hypothetical protein